MFSYQATGTHRPKPARSMSSPSVYMCTRIPQPRLKKKKSTKSICPHCWRSYLQLPLGQCSSIRGSFPPQYNILNRVTNYAFASELYLLWYWHSTRSNNPIVQCSVWRIGTTITYSSRENAGIAVLKPLPTADISTALFSYLAHLLSMFLRNLLFCILSLMEQGVSVYWDYPHIRGLHLFTLQTRTAL